MIYFMNVSFCLYTSNHPVSCIMYSHRLFKHLGQFILMRVRLDSVLKDIPYLLYSLEPCGESFIQLNMVMETRIVSTNVFAAKILPRVACIWLVSTNADSGIIVNVNYIDLYLRALVIGIGSNPGNTGSIRMRRTGGTIPLPAVFDSSNVWIVFDGDDLIHTGYYSNFASSLGFELEVYSPNKSRKLS